jgi:hypothetical protein
MLERLRGFWGDDASDNMAAAHFTAGEFNFLPAESGGK